LSIKANHLREKFASVFVFLVRFVEHDVADPFFMNSVNHYMSLFEVLRTIQYVFMN